MLPQSAREFLGVFGQKIGKKPIFDQSKVVFKSGGIKFFFLGNPQNGKLCIL